MTAILQQQQQKFAICKLCGNSWPLSHNIQINALHLQAAHFMHIAEKHACLMNIDHILNNRRIHYRNFAAKVTKNVQTANCMHVLGYLAIIFTQMLYTLKQHTLCTL